MKGKRRVPLKEIASTLVIAMVCLTILFSIINSTRANPSQPTILSFEQPELIYAVEAGTAREELQLPAELRAVCKITPKPAEEKSTENKTTEEKIIEDEIIEDETFEDETFEDETLEDETIENEAIEDQTIEDESFENEAIEDETIENQAVENEISEEEDIAEKGFRQTEPPPGENDRHGYAAPEDEALLRESGQLVLYLLDRGEEDGAFRVYGTYDGENEGFYACDENGSVTGVIRDIPVTWNGAYDGDTPGVYTLKARIAGYHYSGAMPAAVIEVGPDDGTSANTQPQPQPPQASPPAVHTIDLSTVVNNSNGPGWSYSVTSGTHPNSGTGKVTFNSAASGNEYVIIKSVIGSILNRHITINSDVSDITVTYDGANMLMYSLYGAPPYYAFVSDITVGGTNNTVILENVVNLRDSTVTINSGAVGTTIQFQGVSHQDTDKTGTNSFFTINNSGAGTSLIFDGSNINRCVFNQQSTGAASAVDLRFRGISTFAVFQGNVSSGAALNMKLLLSGSTAVTNGYLTVPANSSLVIDSEDLPGSEQGSLSFTHTSTSHAVVGGSGNSAQGLSSGQITINGGTLEATQKGSGTGSGAASIGGGQGQTGNVIINGGRVTAMNSSLNGGAGIGGGYGASGTVVITNGTVTAGANGGAAIGGGYSQKGIVTISGGTVTANPGSLYEGGQGAGIGGGGGGTGNGIGELTITGGTITARSATGAGIGSGNIGGSAANPGKITVTGGTIVAYSIGGAGVGSGAGNTNPPNTNPPEYEISPAADIVAFSNGQYNTLSGIIGKGLNQGGGYFVNTTLLNTPSDRISHGDTVIVYAHGGWSSPLRVFTLPTGSSTQYVALSYTTGTDSYREDNVFLQTPAGATKQLVHFYDNDPIIPAAKELPGFRGQFPTPKANAMTVKFATGSGTVHTVTEKHVLKDGVSLPGIGDNIIAVPSGTSYSKPVTALEGYKTLGYKWDHAPNGSGSDISTGTPSRTISKAETIYFIYEETISIPVDLIKVNAENTGAGLAGAQFKLYELLCVGGSHNHLTDPTESVNLEQPGPCWAVLEEAGADQVFTSGSDGSFSLGELEDGYYMLVEIKAPDGFERPVGQWLMEISGLKPDTPQGGYKLHFASRSKGAMPNAVIREILPGGALAYKIVNVRPIALPLSGSGGTIPYIIGGCVLMALSLAAVYVRKKRR
ncbi:MAG: SpaA isopeptide-forming pilin-related protein [Oscillospiraceae bacterium]|nr:SpaA isopeptide-forming pilin-related protein [Oscillospiraceae bacterium]